MKRQEFEPSKPQGELLKIQTLPNLGSLVDLTREAARGVQRLWSRVVPQNPQQPSPNPESFWSESKRDLKAVAAGLAAGVITGTITFTALRLMGASESAATVAGFVTLVPTEIAAYLLAQRR